MLSGWLTSTSQVILFIWMFNVFSRGECLIVGIDMWSKDLQTLFSLPYIYPYTSTPDLVIYSLPVFSFQDTDQLVRLFATAQESVYILTLSCLLHRMIGHFNICLFGRFPLKQNGHNPLIDPNHNPCIYQSWAFSTYFSRTFPPCSITAIGTSWVKNTGATVVCNMGFWGPCSCRLLWSCLGLIPGVTFPSYDGLVLGPSDFMTVCLTQPSQWWKVPDAWSLGVPWWSFPSPLWPSGTREAAFQKAYNSQLQLTGSFSRILTACIAILPLDLAINFTLVFLFFVFSPTTITSTTMGLPYHMTPNLT